MSAHGGSRTPSTSSTGWDATVTPHGPFQWNSKEKVYEKPFLWAAFSLEMENPS